MAIFYWEITPPFALQDMMWGMRRVWQFQWKLNLNSYFPYFFSNRLLYIFPDVFGYFLEHCFLKCFPQHNFVTVSPIVDQVYLQVPKFNQILAYSGSLLTSVQATSESVLVDDFGMLVLTLRSITYRPTSRRKLLGKKINIWIHALCMYVCVCVCVHIHT